MTPIRLALFAAGSNVNHCKNNMLMWEKLENLLSNPLQIHLVGILQR